MEADELVALRKELVIRLEYYKFEHKEDERYKSAMNDAIGLIQRVINNKISEHEK